MLTRREPHHVPRGGRGGRGGKAMLPTTLTLVVLILVATTVGWVQLSRYEAKLHALREADDVGAADGGGAAEDLQGYPSFHASLKAGPQSSSAMCAAMLEAHGLLPDAQGRWLGHGSENGGVGAGDFDVGAGGDGAVNAQVVNHLFSRRRLYDAMEESLLKKGLALGSTITQGLGLGDMFSLNADGQLQPVLEALTVPVRAIVLPLRDSQASGMLLAAAQRHLAPLVPSNGIWLQDSKLYHSTIYHASTHTDPVPASAAEVDAEEDAIRAVGRHACPLHVVLERVVATPAGAVVACWQVVKGTDVFDLRRQLAAALPRASKQQIVQDHSILHTTLARIVAPPREDPAAGSSRSSDSNTAAAALRQRQRQLRQRQGRRQQPDGRQGDPEAEEAAVVLQVAVEKMTQELCGLQATMDQLWFAEEYHKLALALNGRVEKREVPLECAGAGGRDTQAVADMQLL